LTMDNNENPSFYTHHKYGLMVEYRYYQEVVPSTGTDLGILMLHQGSEYDSEANTITLQPKRPRVARITRLVRDSSGAIKPQGRVARLKPGTLVKFSTEPHKFDLENLKPVGNPLRTPLPVIDASEYAEAKTDYGLEKRKKQMERFEAAQNGDKKSEAEAVETVAEAATKLGDDGLWACRQDGGWLLIDEACKLVETPIFFDKREELDEHVAELRN